VVVVALAEMSPSVRGIILPHFIMLTSGAKLGPYEILGPLGASGMGEVYRAKNLRLDRTVALKILPELLAKTADSLPTL
jgi:serine/threonine protein kinase